MLCLNCHKGRAQKHSLYGWVHCKKCVKKLRALNVKETIEITTADIKEDRVKYFDDIQQRYEGGRPNLGYIRKYGTKGYSAEEIKQARNNHNTYYRDKEERYN